jgi:CheY-like chemotaxis protein
MVRILVADDDPEVLELLCRIGRRAGAGAEVVRALDGAEALQALTASAFDLAILDCHMPRLTGVQVVRCLQRLRVATPVILVTGWPTPHLAREASAAGAVDLLEKPLFPLSLLALVRQCVPRLSPLRGRRQPRRGAARPPESSS